MRPLRSDQARDFIPPEEVGNGRLSALRERIARMQAPNVALDAPGPVPLGLGVIDSVLGGGLGRGALHDIAAAGEAHIAAATGFALALAVREGKATVWVAEDMALIESGAPYGPGLDLHGLAPEHLLTVTGAKPRDVLWAMEEALHCRAVGAVIGEVRSAREIDLVATRRLSLAAAGHGALALLLRSEPGGEASAAATRWIVGASSSSPRKREPMIPDDARERKDAGSGFRRSGVAFGRNDSGIGPPRFDLALVRNRRGVLGSWIVEWNVSDASFVFATHPEPVARAPVDRQDRARRAA